MDLIKALWNGELSFAKTFWLFGVLGSFLLNIGLVAFPTISSYGTTLIVFCVYLAFYYSYAVLIWVSIWRSATKYSKKHNYNTRNTILSALAKLVVIASIAKNIEMILKTLVVIWTPA